MEERITYLEWIRNFPVEQLAVKLINCRVVKVVETDKRFDYYVCPDGEMYMHLEDAVKHTTEWMNTEVYEQNGILQCIVKK